MEPETRADRDNPVWGGRGQTVGLYVRLHWRGTTALPIRQHRGFCGSQYSAEPTPERLLPPLLPVPSGLFHPGHVPGDRPYGGLAM
jgi:hypothetical protein